MAHHRRASGYAGRHAPAHSCGGCGTDISAHRAAKGFVGAAWQRGYFGDDRDVSCKSAGDTTLTILAGPLNYFGVNPKVDCKDVNVPQPSK